MKLRNSNGEILSSIFSARVKQTLIVGKMQELKKVNQLYVSRLTFYLVTSPGVKSRNHK
jgi:hypothetical protein